MRVGVDDRTESQEARRLSGKSLAAIVIGLLAVIAVAVLALVAFGLSWFLPVSSTETLELWAGAEATESCVPFSPDELANVAEIAFEGTVTAIDGTTVTLAIDEWFEGIGPETAVVNAPAAMEALIGGVPFVVGEQYLISARAGNVNYCGFSGPATPAYRSSFEQAFGG